eukprot:scaffold738_cov340-Pavlova_lutheri.AAC.35
MGRAGRNKQLAIFHATPFDRSPRIERVEAKSLRHGAENPREGDGHGFGVRADTSSALASTPLSRGRKHVPSLDPFGPSGWTGAMPSVGGQATAPLLRANPFLSSNGSDRWTIPFSFLLDPHSKPDPGTGPAEVEIRTKARTKRRSRRLLDAPRLRSLLRKQEEGVVSKDSGHGGDAKQAQEAGVEAQRAEPGDRPLLGHEERWETLPSLQRSGERRSVLPGSHEGWRSFPEGRAASQQDLWKNPGGSEGFASRVPDGVLGTQNCLAQVQGQQGLGHVVPAEGRCDRSMRDPSVQAAVHELSWPRRAEQHQGHQPVLRHAARHSFGGKGIRADGGRPEERPADSMVRQGLVQRTRHRPCQRGHVALPGHPSPAQAASWDRQPLSQARGRRLSISSVPLNPTCIHSTPCVTFPMDPAPSSLNLRLNCTPSPASPPPAT